MNDFSSPFPFYPKSILFVCTGNSCRSVYAEGILKELFARENLDIEVYSAGTEAPLDRQASLKTLAVLKEKGIDLSGHRTRKLDPDTLDRADLVFAMENRHLSAILKIAPPAKEKTLLLSQFYPEKKMLGPDIPDPVGRDDFFYENVHEIIERCCESVLKKLKEETAAYSR